MALRLVPDSVGGQRCVIVYDGERPLMTVWEHEIAPGVNRRNFEDLVNCSDGDVTGLLTTLAALGADYQTKVQAVYSFLEGRTNG